MTKKGKDLLEESVFIEKYESILENLVDIDIGLSVIRQSTLGLHYLSECNMPVASDCYALHVFTTGLFNKLQKYSSEIREEIEQLTLKEPVH